MATARRHRQPQERDLYGPAKPAAWLSTMEMADSSVEEQQRIAAQRRRAALEEYARQHRMLAADVERRFLVRPDRRFTDRAEAPRWMTAHPVEASGVDIRVRRAARLVGARGSSASPGAARGE